MAPSFELLDMEERVVRLSDFKGKFIYMGFWASWNSTCLNEMLIIPKLVKQFGKEIEFISISIDKDHETMVNFLKKNNTDQYGVYLHFGQDKKIKEKYNVRSIPAYVIIDKDGNIVDSFANRPSEGIEHTFSKLLKDKPVGPGLLGP